MEKTIPPLGFCFRSPQQPGPQQSLPATSELSSIRLQPRENRPEIPSSRLAGLCDVTASGTEQGPRLFPASSQQLQLPHPGRTRRAGRLSLPGCLSLAAGECRASSGVRVGVLSWGSSHLLTAAATVPGPPGLGSWSRSQNQPGQTTGAKSGLQGCLEQLGNWMDPVWARIR